MICETCKVDLGPDKFIDGSYAPTELKSHKEFCPETWPDWLKEHFAAEVWMPRVRHVALHRQVLCVAQTRAEEKWSAYCGAVPGHNHNDEMEPVLHEGDKLPEKIARAVFPEFAELKYSG